MPKKIQPPSNSTLFSLFTLLISVAIICLSTVTHAATVEEAEEGTSRYATNAKHIISDKNQEVWIYDINIELTENTELDDYYSALSLAIDFDSEWYEHDIFIVLSLVDEDGYESTLLTSEPFTLFLESISDQFQSSTALKQGFKPGKYDLIIDIYDAESNTWLGYYDKNDLPILADLSLESQEHDFTYDEYIEYVEYVEYVEHVEHLEYGNEYDDSGIVEEYVTVTETKVIETEVSSHGGSTSTTVWALILLFGLIRLGMVRLELIRLRLMRHALVTGSK